MPPSGRLHDRHCAAEKPEARQVRTHTQSRVGIQPSLVSVKPTAKSCFANTMDPQGEPNHTVQLASVRRWGRVLSGAPHPGSSAAPPSTEKTSSIHRNMLLPTKPTPAHWPHRCSPTQTFKGTRGAHFMVCLAQLSDREQAQDAPRPSVQATLQTRVPQPGA